MDQEPNAPQPDYPDAGLRKAQLEKLELETAKLRTEVIRGPWIRTLVALTPLLSVIIGVAGFVFGVYQFRAQQARFLDEQKKANEAAVLSDELQLQGRIRTDVETLLQFFGDNTQTVSSVSFRLNDLKTNLALGAQIESRRRVPLGNYRAITQSFVRAVEDDCRLSVYRHAAFVTVLIDEWPDYGDFLRSRPDLAAVIATKYTDAAHELSADAPEAYATVYFDPKAQAFVWSDSWGGRAFAGKQHFYDLVSGFQKHVRLVSDSAARARIVTRFSRAIRNDRLFSALPVNWR